MPYKFAEAAGKRALAFEAYIRRYTRDTLIRFGERHDGREEARATHWGEKTLTKGGSLYIPAGIVYSFHTGAEPAILINFRARADHSFNPACAAVP